MFVTLPKNVAVDLYTSTKIPSGKQLVVYNSSDVPIILSDQKAAPVTNFNRVTLGPKSAMSNDKNVAKNLGAWAIAVHMDTAIEVKEA